ncbi:sensor histidine kinase [Geomesophilobacter sediminis]|uniref:histidine kinase n=1 Tax=Geomesophilobacter sediminis TaxID=2798584 RepID=A0A8J7S8S5_9BACT|nr:ATP-binding protein [Geomesophilobacter sediminis]MBJ6727777.1 PAS domain-containing protein [Geomesophilobacter sediminis]
MTLLTRIPLRWSIPLALLLLLLLAEAVTFGYSRRAADAQEEAAALELVTQDMHQLQETIRYRLSPDDWSGAQAALSTWGGHPAVQRLVLTDESGKVTASSRVELVGRPVASVFPGLDPQLARRAAATLAGQVAPAPDRNTIVACSPIPFGTRGKLGAHRLGMLYQSYDMSFRKAVRRHALQRHVLITGSFHAACMVALGIFLHLVFSRRVGVLVAAARRFTAGDLAARAGLGGEDELAQLGAAYDRMATEIGRSHEALRQVADKYRVVADNTYDWEFWIDAAGQFVYTSPSCQRVSGRTAGEFLADPELMERIVHPDDVPLFREHRHDLGNGAPATARLQFRIFHTDGSLRWIEHACRPIHDAAGNFQGIRGSNRDITEQIDADAALRKVSRELEQRVEERTGALNRKTTELADSQRALINLVDDLNQKTAELQGVNVRLTELDQLKSMFIASMSHELRTPLNSIIGFSSIMLHGWTGAINHEQQENLEIILRSGRHLLNLVNDVIDVSRIEAGQVGAVVEEFDLGELVAEAVNLVRRDAEERGLALRVAAVPVALRTDRRRLLQGVLNLLSNAVKFTKRGGIDLTVSIEGAGEPSRVAIAVRDTGVGIREQDLTRMFQPFVRFGPPDEAAPGTGLGLYLTHKLVTEVLHGEVTVESELGRGSRFSISIPARLP